MCWNTLMLFSGCAAVGDRSRLRFSQKSPLVFFFPSMESTLVRSVGRSCTSLPVNLSGFLLGSICTGRLSIPRLAWSFPKTEVYIKDLRTRTTNAPEGSSTHNSGENRLKQSTVCAPSAVIQSVSTHTTYA